MDKTDLLLIKMLLIDSRTPYRELAEKLDLSVNAVHKRIQTLMDEGVIRTFTTKVSLPAIGAATVLIYGFSKGRMDEVSAALGEDEHIYWVSQGSGGMIYVGAYLRNIGALEGVVSLVRRMGLLDEPTVGILAGPPMVGKDSELTKLDLRIIKKLERDSRRPVSEIAEELNTSAKTVRRRLDRMLENKLIECSLEWYPDKANDIISMFHLRLSPKVDRGQLAFSLLNKYSPAGLFFFLFSNLPDTILFCTWSSTMGGVNEQRRELDAEEGVISSIPFILYSGQVYETWRERLVDERLAPRDNA
jgi:DNA-binding Lrp family transcriptional regulator